MSRFVSELASPELVVRFQKLCGVEFVVEHEEGAGRLDQQQRSVADDQCGHGEATRLKWSTSDARLRGHSRSADNVGNNNNNNNDKSDGDGECGGSVADAAGSKNGYVQNHHHDRLPISSGVGTTNHPTTTQVLNGYSKNSSNNNHHSSANNICDERPASKESCHPSPQHDLPNGSGTKMSRSESKHEEINHSTRERVVAGKSATRVAIRYPVLYYWAKVGAFLGNEEFYLTGTPVGLFSFSLILLLSWFCFVLFLLVLLVPLVSHLFGTSLLLMVLLLLWAFF